VPPAMSSSLAMLLRALCLVAAVSGQAGKGTKWRCRNRKISCSKWAADNQCTANYPFMAEECPAACDLCTNAGLSPTPASFELDYVCNGKLMPFPSHLAEAAHTPDGCDFHCRDNMTSICAQEAARDGCKLQAEVMRKQCPETCGVCKALGMPTASAADYPKPFCDDAEEHKGACPGWAASGECVKNFGFMSAQCGRSCGLCGDTPPAAPAAGATTGGKKKGKKGKKGKKAAEAGAPGAAAAAGGGDGGAAPSGDSSLPSSLGSTGSGDGGSEPASAASGGDEGADPKAKGGGLMSGVKKAMGKVGDAFKGKKGDEPKAEL